MKKIVFVFLVLYFCNLNLSSANEINEGIKIMINGEVITTEVEPQIIDGTTLVPIRVVLENLGAQVKWNNNTYEVIVNKDDLELIFKIDSTIMKMKKINENTYSEVNLNQPPKIVNGRTLVPIRIIAEKLGYEIKWDNNSKSILISNIASTPTLVIAMSIYITSNNILIKNSLGEKVFQIDSGKINTFDNNIKFRQELAYVSGLDTHGVFGLLTIPLDDYSISIQGESAVLISGNSKMTNISSNGDIKFSVNHTNDMLDITADSDADIAAILRNTFSKDSFSSIKFVGSLKHGEKFTATLDKQNTIVVATNSKNAFDVEINSDQFVSKKIITDIDPNGINGKNILLLPTE